MTPAEAILWKELRGRRFDGVKIRRQQPVGPFIADFFCAQFNIVVELDGETHIGKEDEDKIRQTELERMGFRVLRYTNPDIYDDLDTVLNDIWTAIEVARQGAAPTPHPRPLSLKGRAGNGGGP